MPEYAGAFSIFKKSDTAAEAEEILEKLSIIKKQLTRAYTEFNNTLEPELIEACVFEINSLQSRYTYLIRRAKELGQRNVEVFRYPQAASRVRMKQKS